MASSKSAWNTPEDFEEDIWAHSENQDHTEFKRMPPKTILEYRSRMCANRTGSIFDNDVPDTDVTYFVSGRGRGGRNTVITPGFQMRPNADDDYDIKRKLLQVSGIGYSNEFIEQVIRAKTQKPTIMGEEPNLLLPDLSLKATSSTTGSPKSSPRVSNRSTPNNLSDSSASSSKDDYQYVTQKQKPTIQNVNANVAVETDEVTKNATPPLSVLMKQNKQLNQLGGKFYLRKTLDPKR